MLTTLASRDLAESDQRDGWRLVLDVEPIMVVLVFYLYMIPGKSCFAG